MIEHYVITDETKNTWLMKVGNRYEDIIPKTVVSTGSWEKIKC